MRQVNFTLIFSFGLLMVFFTLVNTAPTTVHVFPGVQNTLEEVKQAGEFEAQQVRIQELETDLNRYRSTVETQLGLLPATTVSHEAGDSDTDS